MAMELRTAWWQDTDDTMTWNGVTLGEPGQSGCVLLARLHMDATVGSEAFEATDSGDMICTVGGVNYIVQPAVVKHSEDGRADDSFLFVGIETSYAPGGNEPAAAPEAEPEPAPEPEPEPEAAPESAEPPAEGLAVEDMTVAQLVAELDQRGVEYTTNDRKADLQQRLAEARAAG